MKKEPRLIIPESVLGLPKFSTEAFFGKVCNEVTDQELVHIAKCDYETDVDENLIALRRIKQGKGWDEPLSWIPLEVLSLHRWGGANENSAFPDKEYKQSVLFAALALHYIGDDLENIEKNSPDILLPMVEMSLDLGEEYIVFMRSELLNVLEQSNPWEEHTLFWIFGLLASLSLDPDFDNIEMVNDVGSWLVEVSDESLAWHSDRSPGAETFLDLKHVTILQDRYKTLASQILEKAQVDEALKHYLKNVENSKSEQFDASSIFSDLPFGVKVSVFFSMVKSMLAMFRRKS